MNKCRISWDRVVYGTGIHFAVKLVCGRAEWPQGVIQQHIPCCRRWPGQQDMALVCIYSLLHTSHTFFLCVIICFP